MMSNSLSDLAYCAGLFDGEGSVLITKSYDYYNMRIQITSTNYSVLEWLVEHFGGNIHQQNEKTENKRKAWHWYCNSKDHVMFLFSILPFTIIKKDQIIVALNYFFVKHDGGKLTEEEFELRNLYYLKLQELKRA